MFHNMGGILARESGVLVGEFFDIDLPTFVVIREEEVVVIVITDVYIVTILLLLSGYTRKK